jgi:Ty3 transposon capsid-like protein
MVGSRKQGTSGRKSARLEKKRQREFGESSQGTNLGSRLQSASGSEEELVVVNPEEVDFASPPRIPNPDEWVERSPTPDLEENIELESSSDEMPTRLKYSKFRGDGSQDVDDWFSEFESIALANQEDLEIKQRIFQGLLKGEALKWYQDIPDDARNDWDNFTRTFLRTFREAGGEARALGRLSRMTMKSSESVRKYGQRVKALLQKLTTEAAPALQVEWYVAGFPKKMGFQIRQERPTTLREAMEAAQNYENSSQSLRKALKRSERKDVKQHRKERSQKKYSDSEDSTSSSESDSGTSTSESSESDPGSSSKHRSRVHKHASDRRGKGGVKVKVEKDDQKKMFKDLQETLEAIKVNLADNRKPRKTVPTSRANVWCPRCGNAGHFASECNMPPQR